MTELSNIIADLSDKNITRKQFLGIMAGGFLSMFGIFRFLQEVSGPRSVGDTGRAFGQSSYGGPLEEELKNLRV